MNEDALELLQDVKKSIYELEKILKSDGKETELYHEICEKIEDEVYLNGTIDESSFGETSFVTNIGELIVIDQPTENSVKIIYEDKSAICKSFFEFDNWIWSLDTDPNTTTPFAG